MKKTITLLMCFLLLLSGTCLAGDAPRDLPLDIKSGGSQPDKAGFTDSGYHDDTLDVRMETINFDNTLIHIAWITVKSPTQLRTAVAGKPNEVVAAKVYQMARARSAVVAINGEFYTNRMEDVFIYRQGEMYRNDPDPTKDVLVIDDRGDFHIFISENKAEELRAFTDNGGVIVNAFSFGPALVIDGKARQELNEYKMAEGKTRLPRMAIAQTGPLSYAFIECEGRNDESRGFTHQMMADFIESLGNVICAYNLDGGQSCTMIFNDRYVDDKLRSTDREQSDIVYVVSAR